MTSPIIYTDELATADEIARVDAMMNEISIGRGGPPYGTEDFSFQARQDNKTIGLLTGKIFWNWMYVDVLFVEPSHQKLGIGRELMQRAETMAHDRKLTGIYCWTQSWQAPEFYKKLGYEEFTKLENLPPGHTRFGFRKYL